MGMRKPIPEEKQEDSASKDPSKEYRLEIVWRNVMVFVYLHVAAVYGLYLLLYGCISLVDSELRAVLIDCGPIVHTKPSGLFVSLLLLLKLWPFRMTYSSGRAITECITSSARRTPILTTRNEDSSSPTSAGCSARNTPKSSDAVSPSTSAIS